MSLIGQAALYAVVSLILLGVVGWLTWRLYDRSLNRLTQP